MSRTYQIGLVEILRRGVGRGRSAVRRGRRVRAFSPELLEPRCLLSTVTEYPLPPGTGTTPAPLEIVKAAGKLWYTDPATNSIGMIDPADLGHPQSFSQGLPNNPPGKPTGLTVGPDGNVWFTVTHGIGMLNTTDPAHPIRVFDTAQGLPAKALPTSITVGPDATGKPVIWFTDAFSYSNGTLGALGMIDPSNPAAFAEYPLPANLQGIAFFDSRIIAGPGGSLWFTEAKLNNSTIVSSAIGLFLPASG